MRKAPSTVQKTPQSPAPPRKHYEVLTPTAQPRRQSVVSTAAPAPAPAPAAEASTEPSIPFKELLRRANEWSKVEEPVQRLLPLRSITPPLFLFIVSHAWCVCALNSSDPPRPTPKVSPIPPGRFSIQLHPVAVAVAWCRAQAPRRH